MRGVVLAAFVALSAGAGTAAIAECADPAGPGVNWEGCDKQSTSLPEADLSGANLRGVDFRDADLRRANLTGADLTDAKLSHSDLSRTIWTDGQVCAIGSDGACD